MRPSLYVGFLIAVCGGCSFNASCGKKTVKDKEFEELIAGRAKELGLVDPKVSCPGDVEAKKDAVFTCAVETEGKSYDIDVTITSIDGDKFAFDTAWKGGMAVVASQAEKRLVEAITQGAGLTPVVECGDPLLFVGKEKRIRCDATFDAVKTGVVVTYKDDGDWESWKLDPPMAPTAKLAEMITPSVQQQTNANVKVDCGPEPLKPRGADGAIWCAISDGKQDAKIKVMVDQDLNLERWEVAEPPK